MFEEIKKEYDRKYEEELKESGLFWAFSNDQFEQNKTYKDAPNEEYLSFFDGGYIHKSDKQKLDDFFNIVEPKLKEDFTKQIKIEDFIEYELINHECYLIGDFTMVVVIIKNYYNDLSINDIYEKVKNIYDQTKEKYLSSFDSGDIAI